MVGWWWTVTPDEPWRQAVAETMARRQAKRELRAQLAAARTAGLRRRHARKLARQDPLSLAKPRWESDSTVDRLSLRSLGGKRAPGLRPVFAGRPEPMAPRHL